MSPHSSQICCHIYNVAHLQWRGLVVKLGMASSGVSGHHASLNMASCTSWHIPCAGLMQKMCGPNLIMRKRGNKYRTLMFCRSTGLKASRKSKAVRTVYTRKGQGDMSWPKQCVNLGCILDWVKYPTKNIWKTTGEIW